MQDQIIPITRPGGSPPASPSQRPSPTTAGASECKFPNETIHIPSRGFFYSADNPLSSGTLELKMMTAFHEDILSSRNLLQKNIVLDKLLEALIVNKAIIADEMLTCDRNAAFFAIRRLAYGDQYEANVTCGRCFKESPVTIDLGKIDNRPFDFEKYTKGENQFEYILPYSKVVVTYKLLSKKDENLIDMELKGMEKISKEFTKETTTRLCHVITSVGGVFERVRIRKFVNDELLSKDSLALRLHIKESTPDVENTFDFICSHCGNDKKEEIPMGISFFWPGGRI